MQAIFMKESDRAAPKGDLIEIRASGTPKSGLNTPFVNVEIPDLMADWLPKGMAWKIEVDYEVVNNNPEIDGWRLRMFSATQNASATQGGITRNQVEAFIANWNGTVHSFGQNDVVFDITIFDAIQSNNFWDAKPDNTWLPQVVFSEVSYDQGTGVHRVEADWSALDKNPTAVERRLMNLGVDLVSHADQIVTFDAARSLVRQAFEDDIREKSRRMVQRFRWRISDVAVDHIVNVHGGEMVTDAATLNSYLIDKVSQ